MSYTNSMLNAENAFKITVFLACHTV